MTAADPRHLVRARHGATTVTTAHPPYDAVHYRIFHPALFTGAAAQRQTGTLPPDLGSTPWPVLIMLAGINVNPDGYRWLATELATLGVATVLFQHVGEIMAGEVGLSPGLDLTALTPEAWSTRPSATVIGPLLDALAADNTTGPLAGLLDLDRVVLAGHSAGGTVALLNANPAWFGGVVAAISYAGHTMPAALLGHPPGTVLAVPGALPALLIAGGNDAIIAASAVRYASDTSDTSDTSGASVARTESTDQHDPISATFERGATAPGSTLAVLATATHLSICDPVDTTSARGFLEDDDPDGPAHRDLIVAIIGSFLDEVLGMGGDHPAVLSFGADPLVSELRRW